VTELGGSVVVALIVHALLGITVVFAFVRANRSLFVGDRPLSRLELTYVLVGVATTVGAWVFNIRFVVDYIHRDANPLWGPGSSWVHYCQLLFQNPASGSASVDFLVINVVILPLLLWTDGRRRQIQGLWLAFCATLFLSCTAGYALYLLAVERQRVPSVTMA
jgi:uncharacterized protein DUF2834